MESQEDGRRDGTNNHISGGVFFHAVILGRDITVHLPPQVTPALSGLPGVSQAFTGRDGLLDQLLKGLVPGSMEEQKPVLVTAVSGLAGIGKTELVAQTAHRALKEPGWFPGGILFVDMAGYDPERSVSPEEALDGWLRALGMPGEHIPEGLQDRQRLYRSVLAAFAEQGRRILVIIDNAASTEQAGPLLPTDGTTATLVTSRHTLVLENARLHDLDVLDEDASAALLERKLRSARDGDTRLADAPDATATIIRLCAGLPLALCIAAALLAKSPTRPAADLAKDLEVEHRRLGGLALDDRAVRASFGLSYQLLDEDHARLFRLLPLNLGPNLSTEAAARLADLDQYETKQFLMDLEQAHLIGAEAESHLIGAEAEWGRWRMHDLVRLYADELGHTHDGPHLRHSARTRLFIHYETTTAAADTHLHLDTRARPRSPLFNNRAAALKWLDAEYANLLPTAITAWALGHPTTAVSLGFSLAHYLQHHRRFHDLITVSDIALIVCRQTRDRHGEAMALTNLGAALREVRRFGEAIDAHTKAAALYREACNRHGEGQALNNLGAALQGERRFGEAIDALTKAADIFREANDRHGEGQALTNLGAALREVRRFGKAIDAHTKAAALYRESGDRHGEAVALDSRGLVLREVRRFGEAIDAHTKAAAIYREANDRHGEGQALTNLGAALQGVRRFGEAIDALTKAAAIYREANDCHGEGQALTSLGLALREVRRFGEAIDAHTKAADIFREANDRHGEGQALTNLGLALWEVRRFGEAIDAHTKAADIFHESGDRHIEAIARNNLGIALREVRRFGEAIDAHTKAADIYREANDRHGEAEALNNLGIALREMSRFEEAVAAHTKAADIYREANDRHGEAEALTNLGAALQGVRGFWEAIDALTKAADIFRTLGDGHREGRALNNLGAALQGVRRFGEAIDAHTKAAAIFRESGDRHSEGGALGNLGAALLGVRRFGEAIDAHTKAAAIFRESGDHHREATVLTNLGLALCEVRRFGEAVAAHTKAADIYREANDRHGEAEALNNLGIALREMSRFEEAVAALNRAVAIYRLLAGGNVSGPEPLLARSLLLLALSGLDAIQDRVLPGTLSAAEEAADLFGRLAAEHPTVFTGLLSASLELLARVLELLHRTWEAERVRRRLADMNPPRE